MKLQSCHNPYFSGFSLAIAPKISSKLENSKAKCQKKCELCANIKIKLLFIYICTIKINSLLIKIKIINAPFKNSKAKNRKKWK